VGDPVAVGEFGDLEAGVAEIARRNHDSTLTPQGKKSNRFDSTRPDGGAGPRRRAV
jgi:hypothetical protein